MPDGHDHSQRRWGTPSVEPGEAIGLRPSHPAAVHGITIFPKSVAHPDDGERIFVSGHNNPKLGAVVTKGKLKGFPIYHLTLQERATCPRSCAQWLSCYGNAMPYARRNDATDVARLWVAIEHELGVLSRAHPGGFLIRLHTLGDFFSVEYVGMWIDWLNRWPALNVFGYTACNAGTEDEGEAAVGEAVHDLNDHERALIRFSSAEPGMFGACVFDEPSTDPDVIMCPAQTGKTECCATCALCWSAGPILEKSIGFLRHGMRR
jgi:hypothetical protein